MTASLRRSPRALTLHRPWGRGSSGTTGGLVPRPGADDGLPLAGAPLSGLVWLVAVLLFIELMAYAGRYGYHRDEMYFIVAGSHPAFGYPDQPPLVPLIAWLMHAIANSLYL